ncbi:MAG: hypothetical protein AB7F40_08260 [Victivallaceae bacterium]|nr:hypothetical protein [Victivallaceae bacterium]
MARMSFDGSEDRRTRHRRHHHRKRASMPLLGIGYKSWIGIAALAALFAILLFMAWRA